MVNYQSKLKNLHFQNQCNGLNKQLLKLMMFYLKWVKNNKIQKKIHIKVKRKQKKILLQTIILNK